MPPPPAQITSTAQLDGRRLLLTDVRLTLMFLNHARYRSMERAFGVSRDQANLATFIAVVGLSEALQAQGRKAAGAAKPPSAIDNLMGLTMLSELLRSVAGPSSRDTPLLGTLMAFAALGTVARSFARKSAHGVYGSSHRMDLAFHRRYGYLVDPGHWRARRAKRREEEERPS